MKPHLIENNQRALAKIRRIRMEHPDDPILLEAYRSARSSILTSLAWEHHYQRSDARNVLTASFGAYARTAGPSPDQGTSK